MDGKPPTYDELLDLIRRQARQIDELRAEVERLKADLEQSRMMSQTQWKVALATPAEIEVNRPWLDQQATDLGTARPGPP